MKDALVTNTNPVSTGLTQCLQNTAQVNNTICIVGCNGQGVTLDDGGVK